jgi:iron complex transport system ATP-binding protein
VLTLVGDARPPEPETTVREIVALGRIPYEGWFGRTTAADDAAIEAALARTGTTPLAARSASTLSAGELQRVHLARAFAQGAQGWLLDEPTANLDVRHQLVAMRLLRSFVDGGGAAIVVLHDLAMAARCCDRLLVIHAGRIHAEGPPRRVLDEPLLAEIFRVHALIGRDPLGSIEHVLALEPLETSNDVLGAVPSKTTDKGTRTW